MTPSAATTTAGAGAGRALVLNATFEPLSVVSWRRALGLILAERADTVVESSEGARSERLTVAIPSVLRLHRYVRVPYRHAAPLSRRAVLARDGWTCQYCDGRADGVDHVRPRSRGGRHEWENVVAACRSCNSRKSDRLLNETNFVLRRAPFAPAPMSAAALQLKHVPPAWHRFLPTGVAAATSPAAG